MKLFEQIYPAENQATLEAGSSQRQARAEAHAEAHAQEMERIIAAREANRFARRQPLTLFQLDFEELFTLCLKVQIAALLAALVIGIPVGLLVYFIDYAVTH